MRQYERTHRLGGHFPSRPGRQSTGTAADTSLDNSWAIASPDEFQQAMQAGSLRADAFSMAGEYDGETGTATGIRGKVLDEAKKYLGVNYVGRHQPERLRLFRSAPVLPRQVRNPYSTGCLSAGWCRP